MARTNKSKGAKKSNSRKRKAPMDDVPQSEEGTTTAHEVSELPEVDMDEEIIRKTKEEELALRFAEPKSKALYLTGLIVKNNRNMTRVTYEENRAGVPMIDKIDRCTEVKQTVYFTRLEYGNKIKKTVSQSSAPPIMLDAHILSTVDHPTPSDTIVPVIPAITSESIPAISVGTSFVPTSGVIYSEGWYASIELRLEHIEGGGEKGLPTIRAELWQVKTQLSALDYQDITFARPIPLSAAKLFSTQPHILTQPCVYHSPERDDEKEKDDDGDISERQSEGDPDSDSDADLESGHTTVRAAGIPRDKVETVIAI
ncbi:hypothetical protein RND71_032070 [Anisodus tanguticus]|uniref:Uncharacterized protein n=1 Tax=Anisodus tanguticus TaxID=243964 RepID=A0AAE1V6D3_9SOLA|nr:hypothetical protein RND71_032070 [Anisodus tanguticus]